MSFSSTARLLAVVLLLAATLAHDETLNSAQLDVLGTSGNNFYHVAELEPGRSIVGATYDGRLVAYERPSLDNGAGTLRVLWNASLGGGFTFSLAVGDIDGNNATREVIVGSASGDLWYKLIRSMASRTNSFAARVSAQKRLRLRRSLTVKVLPEC